MIKISSVYSGLLSAALLSSPVSGLAEQPAQLATENFESLIQCICKISESQKGQDIYQEVCAEIDLSSACKNDIIETAEAVASDVEGLFSQELTFRASKTSGINELSFESLGTYLKFQLNVIATTIQLNDYFKAGDDSWGRSALVIQAGGAQELVKNINEALAANTESEKSSD